MRRWLAAPVIALTVTSGCARAANLPERGFRTVATEDVGLNGRENDGRAPLQYVLLADSDGRSEGEMVERYAALLADEGWAVEPVSESGSDWWTVRASKAESRNESSLVLVGTATSFAEQASILDGSARSSFRKAYGDGDEPMIVVSGDPGA